MPATRTLELRPLSGRIAAEVVDPDLDRLLHDDDARAELDRALLDHQVLVLRGLHPTPEQHIALARAFGEPEPGEEHLESLPDHPDIVVFDSAGGYKADRWHTDVTFRPVIPKAAVLCMRVNPEVGGDTMWANCCAAWDELSNGLKTLLEDRRAYHEITPGIGAVHPVVVTHPETGQRALFVNDIFTRRIVNLPPDESTAILPFLIRHTQRPDFTYRHRWAEGDVVVWDNRVTQHYALFDFEGRRVVHRVGVAGDAPAA
ncbi:MAG: taurine dioxygenase [Acidimicrobiaceae bacterium]|jgi:taurine dioxygenase|nr:taurine dioxygenase [Acidimicrobiaceae bacterium]